MQCPICKQDQVIVEFHGVELDLCLDGHGIWFDGDELTQLFEAAGVPRMLHDLEERVEELPRGERGKRRPCPRCGAKMRHVAVPGDGNHVILDECPYEHGLWFDKGELEEILACSLGKDDAGLARVREFLGQFATGGDGAPVGAPAEETDTNGREENQDDD